MKINKTIEAAVNSHINKRRVASYIFLGTSSWFETTPFKGFAKACLLESEKEKGHSIQLQRYLKNRIGVIALQAIMEPNLTYHSPLDAFEKILAEKRLLTTASHELYALAGKENDFQTQEYLHGLFQEQIKEERRLQDFVDKLQIAENNPDALIHLDYKEEVAYSVKK